MTTKLIYTVVVFETICIIFLVVLLALPKNVVGVMSGEYKVVKVERN
jgi:hypothetical protein